MRRRTMTDTDADLDLVPLIDCVFLILLFFILCGRLSTDQRPEQITVPPGRTAQAAATGPERVVLNLRSMPRPALSFGSDGAWIDLAGGWSGVRQRLDGIWDRSGKRTVAGGIVSEAVLEVRADADLPYHLVQELQQIAADAVDADTMRPGRAPGRSFTALYFAARPPG